MIDQKKKYMLFIKFAMLLLKMIAVYFHMIFSQLNIPFGVPHPLPKCFLESFLTSFLFLYKIDHQVPSPFFFFFPDSLLQHFYPLLVSQHFTPVLYNRLLSICLAQDNLLKQWLSNFSMCPNHPRTC